MRVRGGSIGTLVFMLIFGFFFMILSLSISYSSYVVSCLEIGNIETENSILMECEVDGQISYNYGEYKVYFTYTFDGKYKAGNISEENPNLSSDKKTVFVYIDSLTGDVINEEYSTFSFVKFIPSALPIIGFMVIWNGALIFMIVNSRKNKKGNRRSSSYNSYNEVNNSQFGRYTKPTEYSNNSNNETKKEIDDNDPFADFYNKK